MALSDEQEIIEEGNAETEVIDKRYFHDSLTNDIFYPMTVPQAVEDLTEFIETEPMDFITLKAPNGSLYNVSVNDSGQLIATIKKP